MVIPEQAAVSGGMFACPRCQVVTTLAPRAVATAGTSALITTKPSSAGDKVVQSLALCAAVCTGSVVLVQLAPICAALLGVSCTTFAIIYVVRPDVRPRVDAFLRIQTRKQWRKTAIVVFAGLWSFLALGVYGGWVASGGPERAEAQKLAVDAAAREAAEQKALAEEEVQRKMADAKLDEAEAHVGGGRFDQAREAVRQAQELHSESSRVVAVREKVEKAAVDQAVAMLPEKRNAILEKARSGAWDEAGGLCADARSISPKNPQIEGACGEVDAELRKRDAIKWIAEANRASSEECDTPLTLGNAWRNLRQIRPEEDTYEQAKKSAARLEKCRRSTEKMLSAGLRSIMIDQRVGWATRYESSLLDSGIDANVTLHGKQKDHVKIRYILVGRAMVHQVTKDGEFLAELEKIGFKKVTFSDGYFESWYFDLSPQDESNGGRIALRDVGLDEPIKM